jgi:alkylation response protein AidB-like acyl-CoA dehydrogenase
VRRIADGAESVDGRYRQQAAELGWFSMLVPEEQGGGSVSENGLVDASLIAAIRGAALQPGGFIGTNVVASALCDVETPEVEAAPTRRGLVAALVGGQSAAAWAMAGPKGEPEPGSGVTAVREGDTYQLSGTKTQVEAVAGGDHLLVTGRLDGALTQFLVPVGIEGLTIQRMRGLDLTRAYDRVDFDRVRLPAAALVGEPGRCDALVDRQFQIASVLLAAEMVGAMDRNFQDAVAYAKDRVAFGRPIGSFQAIKHLLADTSLALEMSKAVVAAAAEAVGARRDDAAELASIAKAFVSERGITLTQNCFQVFGGIGYTWEHDHHLFMRRITSDAAIYGNAPWHRERICANAGV